MTTVETVRGSRAVSTFLVGILLAGGPVFRTGSPGAG
jgi:hypothetical protein